MPNTANSSSTIHIGGLAITARPTSGTAEMAKLYSSSLRRPRLMNSIPDSEPTM